MAKRINYWDNLKCFLIILVVVGHFIEPLVPDSPDAKKVWLWIYSFHMPLFIFIAGYFHRNVKIIPKMYMYFALGFLSKFLLFVPRLFWSENPGFSLLSESGLPWFMFAMGLFIGVSYLLRNLDARLVLGMSILIAFFAGYDKSVKDYFVLSRFLVFFPFYYSGVLLQPINIPERLSKIRWSKLIGIFVLGGVLFLFISNISDFYHFRPYFTGRNPYGWHRDIGIIFRMVAYFISFVMCIALLAACPRKNLGFFTVVGSRSLQIYFWHRFFISIAVHYGILSLAATSIGKLIYGLLAVAFAIFLSLRPWQFPVVQIKNMCLNKKETLHKY